MWCDLMVWLCFWSEPRGGQDSMTSGYRVPCTRNVGRTPVFFSTSTLYSLNTSMNCAPIVLRFFSGSVTPLSFARRRSESSMLGHRQMQVILEHLHHALLLLVPQQTVIHEAAVKTIADRLVHQRRRHRGVHAARERADDVVIRTNLLVDDGDLLVEHVLHRPTRGEPRDVEEEVTDRLEPALGVGHLGVVLEAEDLALGVLDGDHGARVGLAHAREALGELHRLVAVGHPHLLGGVHLLAVEDGGVDGVHGHATVLGLLGRLDLAAEALDDELHAVADAEDGDVVGLAVIEEALRGRRGRPRRGRCWARRRESPRTGSGR